MQLVTEPNHLCILTISISIKFNSQWVPPVPGDWMDSHIQCLDYLWKLVIYNPVTVEIAGENLQGTKFSNQLQIYMNIFIYMHFYILQILYQLLFLNFTKWTWPTRKSHLIRVGCIETFTVYLLWYATYLPTYLPTYIHTYLPTNKHTYIKK